MKKLPYVLLLFFLNSCNDNISIYRDEVLQKNPSRMFAVDTFSDGIVSEFRDKGSDSIQGGYYCFHKNGLLKSYQYFFDLQHYGYNEEYDVSGKLIKIENRPLLFKHIIRENVDSACIKMYFFSLNKNYKKVNIITSDNRNIDIKLLDDTLYSNMKLGLFGFNNLKEKKDMTSYISVEYENEYTHKNEKFMDTIYLHYSPPGATVLGGQ
jgi:hypothetical protein